MDTPSTPRRILALIPARGNSKGLPGKNILPFDDAPLIAHTIRAATDAQCFDEILVSTDAQDIRAVALEYGASAPFLRPPELAGDTARTLDVVTHALAELRARGRQADVVVLLQPTSPLRTHRHIQEALALFLAHAQRPACTVVSVVAQDPKFRWLLAENDDATVSFLRPTELVPRQALRQVYLPNGAIYIAHADAIGAGFFGDATLPYPMQADDSIDIDTRADFDAALALLRLRRRASSA